MKTFTKICNIFDSYNYQIIPTDSKKVKMYATFNNSSLYLVNIISLDSAYTFSKEKFEEYKVITKEQFGHMDSNKIILLNLIITENALDIYKDVNYTPDFDEDLIDINWIIDDNEGKLIIPNMQVNNVIGIEKDIRKLLEADDESWGPKIIQESTSIPYITYGLLAINIIFFIYMEKLGGTTNILNLVKFGAIDYYSFFTKGEYYRIITSMFIHIGALHLLYNMFSLFIFGTRIERYMKKWEYILLYGLSGISGGLLSITVDLVNQRPVISAGASGAIYGLIGAILVYSRVYKKYIGGLNSYTILIMFIVGIAFGTMNSGISNLAHLGGFIGGALVAYILTLRKQA